MRILIGLSLLITLFWGSEGKFDSFYSHQVEAKSVSRGESLYKAYCADCHHRSRIGYVGPPLLPETLARQSVEKLAGRIKNGFPATLMPAYEHLSDEELTQLAVYIKSETPPIVWGKTQIKASKKLLGNKPAKFSINDFENLTVVVERNAGRVWLMEDDRKLTDFPVANVHGGIKFTLDKKHLYVPSRDGKITKYDIDEGQLYGEVRACVNMRNISLDNRGEKLFATCLLPESIEVFDAQTLDHLKSFPVEGKISALYELYGSDRAVFTFRNKPLVGFIDTKKLTLETHEVAEPIEDFFIEPFETHMIATARRGSQMVVYDMATLKPVFSEAIKGMPHLFSATWWYQNGEFFFATPHLGQNHLSVWRMYDWKMMRTVDVGGSGFFAKTHPATPYLWVDNGSDTLTLIDKRTFATRTLKPRPGMKFNHTEFSGDGKFAYLSIYEDHGHLVVLDTLALNELASYPARLPVGKYNFINKNRVFGQRLFGEEVFKAKCWGCHHQSAEAFGPSFKDIADRLNEGEMIAHIENPAAAAKAQGYPRALMPTLGLTPLETLSVVEYVKSFADKE